MAAHKDVAFSRVGMLGVGSMGSMTTLLMVEEGCHIFFFDPSEENIKTLDKQEHELQLHEKITRCNSYSEVCEKINDEGKPRVFILSTLHGGPADKCVNSVQPPLEKGDIIIDRGNEHWTNTERRQAKLDAFGGPGESDSILRTIAAQDKNRKPCTVEVEPGGNGHYVKMVVAEVRMLFTNGLGLPEDDVSQTFKKWNAEGPLHDCFLVAIGVEIEQFKGKEGQYVLASVRDKVAQDVDEEEGIGT
ncbi:uncharacterized protein B0I36DRAFT_364161 [Microdochium trichocladiopsis]|uniref:phosphogluconate dehydrogenase (NADP(+)-dependent, decarboxylating) n=1 Tax=Microdochium trichocladiopsis TaxID=1682393 RepID=A0A9P9BPU9_9PEZI|nr:uncharacterized protein B0I36DRAFT_364161 [Microdochium trichocladiopsis]KAH7029649.1 hypothetical protein B0I36DRAFT_364161 [Microdochium trichocladiopsis]